jgi:hypothetical protein
VCVSRWKMVILFQLAGASGEYLVTGIVNRELAAFFEQEDCAHLQRP